MTDTNDVEAAAAGWVLREDSDSWDEEAAAARNAWLEKSMLHRVTYWRLKDAWKRTDRLAVFHAAVAPKKSPRSRRAELLLVASLLVVLVPAGAWWFYRDIDVIKTPVGGHKSVVLSDGSLMELNTNTEVRIVEGNASRRVKIDHGEVFFQVRHDPKHPFVVMAGNRRIVDLGTRFLVRVNNDDVSVTVQEGHVRVETADRTKSIFPVEVGRNAELVAAGDTSLLTQQDSKKINQRLGWRTGMLIFDDEPLAEVAEELNRYNERKIEIANAKIANTRIAGSFQATNLPAFVRLLQRAYGFQIDESGDRVVISN